MTQPSGDSSRGPLNVGFLGCPPETLLDGFAHRPAAIDPALVRGVSSHLTRCALCREEVDRRRRDSEAAGSRRPWLWALVFLSGLLGAGAAVILHEPFRPAATSAVRFSTSFTGNERDPGPEPRIAALARFEPPSEAAIAASLNGPLGPTAVPVPPLSADDQRELSAARTSLDADRFTGAARLLEDLAIRHPSRGGLRLLLAYAQARSGEFEKAQSQYALADELGVGVDACLGLANASLRLGDIATARRELIEHILSRRPDDAAARMLLDRIDAARPR